MSLKYRIALVLLVLQTLLAVLVLWRTLGLTREHQQEHLERDSMVMLNMLAELGRTALATYEYSELQSFMERMVEEPRIVNALLIDHRLRVVASSNPAEIGSDLPDFSEPPGGGESPISGLGPWHTLELRGAGGPLGMVAIRFSDAGSLRAYTEIRDSMLRIVGVCVAITALLGVLFGHLLTRRLRAIGRTVKNLAASTSGNASDDTHDEVSQMGTAFEDLARSLEDNLDQLREREAQLQLLTDAIPIGISYVDRDLNLLFLNKELARWLDRGDRSDVIGRNLAEIMSPEALAETRRGLAPALRGAMVERDRLFVIDGKRAWVAATNVPDLDEQGKVRGVYSLLRNITRRRRKEAEREALMSELEARNGELDRFASTIAHDLKAPLVTILGRTDLLEDDLIDAGFVPDTATAGPGASEEGTTDPVAAAVVEHLGEIRHAATSMGQMLEDLLHLARMAAPVDPFETVDLADLTAGTARLLAGDLDRADLEVRIADDLPPVSGDRTRLTHLMQNLLSNAIKHSSEAEPRSIEVGHHQGESGELVFWVKDHGEGIPEEHLERIFGLFEQVRRDRGGSGLGLSICQRIVELHGGTIWAESAGPGNGARFCFTLPGDH